jgi:maltokinase
VYEELASLSVPVPVQRVHGDLHLAQMMRVTSGWRILDF